MKRMRELDRLRNKVAVDRQRVELIEARWLVAGLAFVSGLLLPPLTGKSSANPVAQLFAFLRTFALRAMRFVVFRNLWEVLRKHDIAEMGIQAGK